MTPPPDRPPASSGLLDPPGFEPRRDRGSDDAAGPVWGRSGRANGPGTDFSGPNGRNGTASRGHEARGRHRTQPAPRIKGHYRRWPRRILLAANLLVAAMLIGALGVFGYANWRFGQIKRLVIPGIAGTAAPGAPMTILVVGSDSRAGGGAADQAQFGSASQVAGQRSDTMMLVRIDPSSTKATLLSIPRDLWVNIPGTTHQQRINTTFDTGPALLVRAVQEDLNIPIDHYVEVNFQSFRQMVSAVGGVKEYFPTPARDAYSLLNIPAPGCYTLDGNQALSFVRARHYEYKVNGRWLSEAASDLARIKRQQSFIKKVISKAQASGLTNPIQLNSIIGSVTNNLTIDKNFSTSLMLSLAKRFRSLQPDSLPTVTLPTTQAVIQGNDVLLLQQPQAQQVISDFLATGRSSTTSTTAPATSVLPSQVQVKVLNGSGRPGEAALVKSGLERDGFAVTTTGSADNYGYATSVVRYKPGAQAKAQLVANVVQGGSQLQVNSNLTDADVELVTGATFRGISAAPAGGGGTAVSTAPKTTPASIVPATPPVSAYELPGTPAGFVPPPC
ncbi:MAG: LCP family protein [Actinomycetota bacterium]|nr:LCP family protein [Actinomycetota bacterium]